ncbi:MAG: 2OG-Fe(II) oxygenase, partial [Methylobacteriaceae bacterium]|nr:2OG-Fe(II) oxygenase [Methylobacteriaceae bacterium]
MSLSLVNVEAIRQAEISRDPYDHLLGGGMLRDEAIDDLRRDFPAIDKPGYLTVDEVQLKGRFKLLIEELESPDLTEELSRAFGRDLHPFPRLTTIMRRSQPKYGSIHTDGPSKIMTMLVYMNDNWSPDEGGRLRVLYDGEHFEPYKVEVPPV